MRVPPSQGRGFFRGMLGPRPRAKKVFQLLPPGFRGFSPLSPFLLESRGETDCIRNWGSLQEGPSSSGIPYLWAGEAGALEAMGSVGVPSRPWVRACASSSVSRRVDWLLPARDLGLGRRHRPGELGERHWSAQRAIRGHRQSQAGQPKPRPDSVPTRAGKAGPRWIRRERVGSRQVR